MALKMAKSYLKHALFKGEQAEQAAQVEADHRIEEEAICGFIIRQAMHNT